MQHLDKLNEINQTLSPKQITRIKQTKNLTFFFFFQYASTLLGGSIYIIGNALKSLYIYIKIKGFTLIYFSLIWNALNMMVSLLQTLVTLVIIEYRATDTSSLLH